MLTSSSSTIEKPDWPVLLLALMLFMVPAMGVPSEALLQDTLKSILVSFFSLSAAALFFWGKVKQPEKLLFHPALLLPALLSLYALGSMFWSHSYLAGVEASRWFVIALIALVGSNTFTKERVERIAWGIHWGALVASFWTALQYWTNFELFPQGAPPAATFVNRNFFAEFLVVALPFSALLVHRARSLLLEALLSVSIGFQITALMMAGTRSALVALVALALICGGYGLITFFRRTDRSYLPFRAIGLTLLCLSAVLLAGQIEGKNQAVNQETGGNTSVQRSLARSATIVQPEEYTRGSMALRYELWQTTGKMIAKHWITGVGAGAWEVHAPLFQTPDKSIETDYYAHNEVLQLLSEFGLIGWLFLAGLIAYIGTSIQATWHMRATEEQEVPLRTAAITSLFMLFIVSNTGFPLRLATTCALFATCLGVLMASDLRLRPAALQNAMFGLVLSKLRALGALAFVFFCFSLAIYIATLAVVCEGKLTLALKAALTVSQSDNPKDPRWNAAKLQIVSWTREGVAINPHYRKLTPAVADAMAGWGDWNNARWVWESAIESRPYVSGILMNLARSQISAENHSAAEKYLQRSEALQPGALQNTALRILLLARTNQLEQATKLATNVLESDRFSEEISVLGYALARQSKNDTLLVLSLESRITKWPEWSVDAHLKLGNFYALKGPHFVQKALDHYQKAISTGAQDEQGEILGLIPLPYRKSIKSAP